MEENLLCQRMEQTALTNLYERVNELLLDSDDAEDKTKIKQALQAMAENTAYMVIGEEGSGKTSLLRRLFQDVAEISELTDADICEYRWGEQSFSVTPTAGYQKKFQCIENLKGISILDTRGVKTMQPASVQKVRELVKSSGAILVVFDIAHIRCPKVWDILESVPAKKAVFFLTKCDQASTEEIIQARDKIKTYMNESGINEPVFAVSMMDIMGGAREIAPIEMVRKYIREEVVGVNPLLKKQQQNVEDTRQLLQRLKRSFALRKKQYESDAKILHQINRTLDDYVINHKQVIERFNKVLAEEISGEIDNYQQEIISKLDPWKIKERFKSQADFTEYLNWVNEQYRTRMNDSINRKTIETLKRCMGDLEIVFQEAVGYFNKRENILDLNDKFYGTLADSRKQMVVQTRDLAVSAGQFYRTLSDASETLFLQIWEERKKFDRSVKTRKTFAPAGGGAVGAGAGYVVGAEIAAKFVAAAPAAGNAAAATGSIAAETAATATAAAVPTVKAGIVAGAVPAAAMGCFMTMGIVIIGLIAGAVLINHMAKTIFDTNAAQKMEENVALCIEEFKKEVANTKQRMTQQVTDQVTEIFENELTMIDSCFKEFRMTVNIDEKRIPLLEEKIAQVNTILEQLEQMAYAQR